MSWDMRGSWVFWERENQKEMLSNRRNEVVSGAVSTINDAKRSNQSPYDQFLIVLMSIL
jgi:hypothetical protein